MRLTQVLQLLGGAFAAVPYPGPTEVQYLNPPPRPLPFVDLQPPQPWNQPRRHLEGQWQLDDLAQQLPVVTGVP